MQVYRVETVIPENGIVQLQALPFERGVKVEIIVLGPEKSFVTDRPNPLKGTVLKYDAPFEPVCQCSLEQDLLQGDSLL